MTLVVDSSVVIAALLDEGSDGTWADQILADELFAPHLMQIEAANLLRRAAISGQVSRDAASLAHLRLLSMAVRLFRYEPFAARVWELHPNVTAYDAWYVAIAEALDAPLATLDRRLSRADGPRCRFLTPPER